MYVWELEVNPTLCKCTNMKNKAFQEWFLLIINLFAKVECFFKQKELEK